jgi:hypothetical protein
MKGTNIFTHLAATAIATILVALIYTSVQQDHRSGANDPQLQMARDISNDLKNQAAIDKWFSSDKIEISQSLSVFGALYNDRGEPLMSTGVLNGKMPLLPRGVFDFAKNNGEDVFTWQPRKGTRMAIVLKSLPSSPYSFVAVGRSLYEVEKREQNLLGMSLIGWLLCMGVIILHWIIIFLRARRTAIN